MTYWGWRPLIGCVFIGVLVVSCTPAHSTLTPSVSPTHYPPVTLTLRSTRAAAPLILTASPTETPPGHASTPAPTATPVIHIIQAGDTLLGIALNYGVDLAALQAANPGVDSRALSIGQEIVIPVGGVLLPSAAAPAPTSTPLLLTVYPPTCTMVRGGSICLGVVENPLTVPVERVAVEVQRGDQVVSAPLEQRLLLPGMNAPYQAFFPQGPDQPILALLRSADEAPRIEQRYAAVQVVEQSASSTNGRYQVRARLIPDVAVEDLRAVVMVFGSDDRLLGYRVVARDVPLSAGDPLDLLIDVALLGSAEPARHTLYVEARRGE